MGGRWMGERWRGRTAGQEGGGKLEACVQPQFVFPLYSPCIPSGL